MAVIINNMDLPDNCQSCKFKLESNRCQFTYDIVADNVDKRRYNCPLEPVGEKGEKQNV